MHENANAVRWGVRIHLLGYVAGNLAQVLVWWLVTPDQHFWPIWSIVGWGAGLVVHVWTARVTTRRILDT